MEKEFRRLSGISLITGSLLLVATMILHPSGGNVEHILKMRPVLIGSHSLAILSLPFITFGFWGLSFVLITSNKVSMLSFIVSCFGLFAALIAAVINGLTLPMFLTKISQEDLGENFTKVILKYGNNINVAMDYVLMCSLSISICIWSGLIIRQGKLPKWIGYYGFLTVLAGLISAFNGYNLVGLSGFRIVVFATVGWIVLVAYKLLINQKEESIV